MLAICAFPHTAISRRSTFETLVLHMVTCSRSSSFLQAYRISLSEICLPRVSIRKRRFSWPAHCDPSRSVITAVVTCSAGAFAPCLPRLTSSTWNFPTQELHGVLSSVIFLPQGTHFKSFVFFGYNICVFPARIHTIPYHLVRFVFQLRTQRTRSRYNLTRMGSQVFSRTIVLSGTDLVSSLCARAHPKILVW